MAGREPGATAVPAERGSTKPLRATSPVCHSCSKSSVNALRDRLVVHDGDHVLLPRPRIVRPVESSRSRRAPSRTTNLWCIRSGTPAIAFPLDGQAGDQQHVRLGRRRHRDRVRVVDVVGEAHAHATVGRAAHRVPDDARVLLAEREVVLREVERLARRRRRTSATSRAISPGCWPPSVRVRISMRSLIDRLRRRPHRATRPTSTATAPAPRSGGTGSRRYLDERAGAPILLVGEAPGYRGARVSGLPFTSERQLTGQARRRRPPRSCNASSPSWARPRACSSGTSSRPIRAPRRRTARPRARRSRPARRSRSSSHAAGASIAVGRIAAAALGAPYVRHPSHGGARAFADGLAALIA